LLPFLADPAVLTVIGRNLLSLDLWILSEEVVDGIVDNCTNLHHLELGSVKFDGDEEKAALVGLIKSGLKRLAKFKLNEESIRLGTDWKGYELGVKLSSLVKCRKKKSSDLLSS
jgi:hypothetical protein